MIFERRTKVREILLRFLLLKKMQLYKRVKLMLILILTRQLVKTMTYVFHGGIDKIKRILLLSLLIFLNLLGLSTDPSNQNVIPQLFYLATVEHRP
jgi:hypothetical protein